MQRTSRLFLLVLLALAVAGGAAWHWRHRILDLGPTAARKPPLARATLVERVRELTPEASARLRPSFDAAGVPFPPAAVRLVAFKDQRLLALYARGPSGPWRLVRRNPVLAASGVAGPKLAEGDRQVPEGRYRITFLNPNSQFHVSLRLDYPNAEDRAQAARDGRRNLGGDIMIHGSNVSIGCLAMGDEVAEDLFVLAALTGITNVEAIITPTDLRIASPPPAAIAARPWVGALYGRIRKALDELPPA
jgi:hypothetical protein